MSGLIHAGTVASQPTYLNKLPGVRLWVRADDTVNNGTTVQTMNNKVSGGASLTQATSGERPFLSTVSGKPSVRFWDGSFDYRYVSGGNLSTYISAAAYHFFAVFRVEGVTLDTNIWENHRIIGGLFGNAGALLRLTGGTTPEVYALHHDGSYKEIAFGVTTGQTYLLEWWFTGSQLKARLNDSSISTIAAGNVSDLANAVRISAQFATAGLRGHVLELAIANQHSEGNPVLTAIRADLGFRYGVAT